LFFGARRLDFLGNIAEIGLQVPDRGRLLRVP
jgi:hypothetical protein